MGAYPIKYTDPIHPSTEDNLNQPAKITLCGYNAKELEITINNHDFYVFQYNVFKLTGNHLRMIPCEYEFIKLKSLEDMIDYVNSRIFSIIGANSVPSWLIPVSCC